MANINNRDSFSATTSLIQFFDENGNQLRLSGHDTGLSIGIWEPVVDSISGKKTYPTERRTNTFVSVERILSLSEIITDILLPSYKEGKENSVSIFTKQDRSNMIEVSYRGGSFYIAIHIGIDGITLVPRFTTEFKFSKTTIVTGYDRTTGHMSVEEMEGYFYLFNKILLDYTSIGGCGIAGHSVRNTSKGSTDKMFRYLNDIAVKVGVPVNTYTGYQTPRNNNYSSSQDNSAPNPNYNEVTDISQILQ